MAKHNNIVTNNSCCETINHCICIMSNHDITIVLTIAYNHVKHQPVIYPVKQVYNHMYISIW